MGPLSFLLIVYRVSFPGTKLPKRKLTSHLHFVQRLKICDATPLFPLHAFKAQPGTKLYFPQKSRVLCDKEVLTINRGSEHYEVS
jgi:hypothetical protein